MAILIKKDLATMLLLPTVFQCLVHIAEGGIIHHQNLLSEEHGLSVSKDHGNIDDNDIDNSDHLDPKFFRNMVNTNYELTAVESHRGESLEYPPEERKQSDVTSLGDDPALSPSTSSSSPPVLVKNFQAVQAVTANENQEKKDDKEKKKSFVLILSPNWKTAGKVHHRQKRFITPYKLRTIAVPLSIFNFLGFLPVKIPGLPYHRELPPPDYTYYNTIHEFHYPRRYSYF